jgi:transcriptional regulator with XRE-family HTH domain/tetratricopeptide (TPR) repeat protein
MAPFGQLLRTLRIRAGLTQEELAEAAGISARTVSDLERGVNSTARKDTARLIADALGLKNSERAEFEAAARVGAQRTGVAVVSKTLPRDITSFTGRENELRQIEGAFAAGESSLFAIGGMAGVGKTAFAVHAGHNLAPLCPDGQVFLPLHAHTPGQRPVDPSSALASLLRVIGVPAEQVPADRDGRMWLWRDQMAAKKVLLVLDDAVDSDQVRPLLPGATGSLVLVTSRLHLAALDDATEVSLDALTHDEAIGLLVRLASRPADDRADPATAEIARLCGCLPLALGMLARRLHHHPTWTAADLASELAVTRNRLAMMNAENLSVAAAFDLSFHDLTVDQQRMFGLLGVYPGTDIDAYAAAALAGLSLDTARKCLDDLYDHYLLAEPARGRYRLHDLIREYAHELADFEQAEERVAAADRVLGYFLHTARLADHHLGRRVPTVSISRPAHVPDMATREDAIAWMETERINLHATAQHAAECGRPDHAAAIPAAMHEFLRGQGHWQQALALDSLAIQAARAAGGQVAEARALADMADMQYLTDDYADAIASLRRALQIYEGVGNQLGQANVLTQLGSVSVAAGEHGDAMTFLSRALDFYLGLGDKLGEANARTELGAAQYAAGLLGDATDSLVHALAIYRSLGDRLGEANALAQFGAVEHASDPGAAAASVTEALAIYRGLGDKLGEARSLNALAEGALTSDVSRALEDYRAALAVATSLGASKETARALEGIGRCCLSRKDSSQGLNMLREALVIYRRIRSPRSTIISALLEDLDGPASRRSALAVVRLGNSRKT